MDSSLISPIVHVLCFIFIFSLPFCFADPDLLQDFCVGDLKAAAAAALSINGLPCKNASQVTSDDFFFNGLVKEGDTNNPLGFSVTFGHVFEFPGVNTLGVSMNRVDYAPGGLNAPHLHPRSSEVGVVIKGKILVGFVTTGNVLHSKVLTAGQVFVVPRGLVHFQLNVGKGKAQTFTAFNSQLPGVVPVPPNLFASNPPIPTQVLSKAFQVGDDVINDVKSKFGFE